MESIYLSTSTAPCFYVGRVPVFGDLILSPMDGFSDLPFRSICRELGSALSYTEFINAIDVLQGDPRLERKLAFLQKERPVVYQLFDDQPERLLQAALIVIENRPDIIDINLGCPARTVSGRGAGSGLLREPEKIARIFQLLTHSINVPVTAKIRLGWDESTRNYALVARILEENGAALVAVHGRTRSQKLAGRADWDAIAEIRQAVRIPVIGNGDVVTVEDIDRMKSHTGMAGVMIGRAAVGNPWIFSRLDRGQVPLEQVQRMIVLHLEKMLSFYGEERGLVLFRKHCARYIQPYPPVGDWRTRLMAAGNKEQFLALVEEIPASILPVSPFA
ncbi:MAG: tRNA dihydrouridine synthase DusB [Omnitrophica WOR_2 bacterium]